MIGGAELPPRMASFGVKDLNDTEVGDHVWLAALSRQRSGERIAGRKAAASGRDRARKNSDAGVRAG